MGSLSPTQSLRGVLRTFFAGQSFDRSPIESLLACLCLKLHRARPNVDVGPAKEDRPSRHRDHRTQEPRRENDPLSDYLES